ncbi:SH3 domain-containing protein [Aestuariicoccus sp. MJ-SS9]|uniref:SH3 domain-containing protein n=1 Tax=Aestuariicoccus sp. MJ-SS9 TaxID=3079855 RepID=UPI00290B68C3|nr:SH3 domain-containing protein [Aestuariicoccus sp. MJ-SS9]MDU8913596.1 SH3 domain-containing protein [Aestuariicoccus sp. MJ-SS9]
MNKLLKCIAVVAALSTATQTLAQEPRTERVQFPAGQSRTTINASLTGYESVEYLLGARAGQRMAVEMFPSNPSTYFNIFAPGNRPGQGAAMYVAATNGLRFDGVLPSNGDYRVQVFINRNAARRNESTNYTLNVSIGGAAPSQDFADGLSGGPNFWEVFGVSQSLNVRAAPSTSAQVVMGLLNGTIVQNRGCRSNEGRVWCQIAQVDGGATGWAASQYLREAAAPSASTRPAVSSGNVMRVAGVPSNDVLNVRSGPGTGNPIVGALANGDPVRVMGCQSVGNTRWCEIEMITDMRERGWVAGRYLSAAAASAPTSSVSPAEQACLRAVTVETNNPDVVLLSSSFSQAGTEVMVGVGPQRAPWQCIAYSDGSTTRPMSMQK